MTSTAGASTSDGRHQAADALDEHDRRRRDEQDRVGERADRLEPVEAVGVGGVRLAGREACRAEPDDDRHDVDHHVGRIGEQREAAGHEAPDDLEREHADREQRARRPAAGMRDRPRMTSACWSRGRHRLGWPWPSMRSLTPGPWRPRHAPAPGRPNQTRSQGAARRYRTMSRIWKIGMVAAGIATSGENAVVAIAIAVPLFLPVLVKATAMCSA